MSETTKEKKKRSRKDKSPSRDAVSDAPSNITELILGSEAQATSSLESVPAKRSATSSRDLPSTKRSATSSREGDQESDTEKSHFLDPVLPPTAWDIVCDAMENHGVEEVKDLPPEVAAHLGQEISNTTWSLIYSMKNSIFSTARCYAELSAQAPALEEAIQAHGPSSAAYHSLTRSLASESAFTWWKDQISGYSASTATEKQAADSNLRRGFIGIVKAAPHPLWCYLFPLLPHLTENNFRDSFKVRNEIIVFLEQFRDSLSRYFCDEESEKNWEIDVTRQALSRRASEFLSQTGNHLLSQMALRTPDERLVKKLDLPDQVHDVATNLRGQHFFHTPKVIPSSHSNMLSNVADVKFTNLTPSEVTSFIDAVKSNKLKFNDYSYNRELIPDSTKQLLDLMWQNYRVVKEGDPTDGWKKLSDNDFYKFLEQLASSRQSSDSTTEEVFREIRGGLNFDPLNPVDTLKQITHMLTSLDRDGIKLSKEQLQIES